MGKAHPYCLLNFLRCRGFPFFALSKSIGLVRQLSGWGGLKQNNFDSFCLGTNMAAISILFSVFCGFSENPLYFLLNEATKILANLLCY